MWQRLPKYLHNKYTITILAFVMWLLFFDQYDVFRQMEFRNEVEKLEMDKAYFENQIKETKQELTGLMENEENLERFAREKYFMKKENEEIFVITKGN